MKKNNDTLPEVIIDTERVREQKDRFSTMCINANNALARLRNSPCDIDTSTLEAVKCISKSLLSDKVGTIIRAIKEAPFFNTAEKEERQYEANRLYGLYKDDAACIKAFLEEYCEVVTLAPSLAYGNALSFVPDGEKLNDHCIAAASTPVTEITRKSFELYSELAIIVSKIKQHEQDNSLPHSFENIFATGGYIHEWAAAPTPGNFIAYCKYSMMG